MSKIKRSKMCNYFVFVSANDYVHLAVASYEPFKTGKILAKLSKPGKNDYRRLYFLTFMYSFLEAY